MHGDSVLCHKRGEALWRLPISREQLETTGAVALTPPLNEVTKIQWMDGELIIYQDDENLEASVVGAASLPSRLRLLHRTTE